MWPCLFGSGTVGRVSNIRLQMTATKQCPPLRNLAPKLSVSNFLYENLRCKSASSLKPRTMPVRQKSWGLTARPLERSATIEADENDTDERSTDAAVKYWLSEAEKLQPEQRILFLRGAEANSYEDYVSGLTRAVQSTTNSSKVSRLSKKMKPVYVLVKSIAPLIASTDQVSPFPTSLVLGGITCILSASNRVDDYQSKLIETMEQMAEEIELINEYRQDGVFDDDPGIKSCELELATDILQFCVKVTHIFYDESGKERNSLYVAMKAQLKDFDAKFGDTRTHFDLHVRALEKRRDLVNTRWAKATNIGVKEISKFIDRNSQDKTEAVEELLQKHKEDEAKERAQRRKEFLNWLPFIDFGEIHENAFERSVEGTGDWLTKNDSYKAWSASPSSTMLWIYGKHGSGKSHLASRIIQNLKRDTTNAPGHAVAYVYCTTTQSKTEMTLNNILGSLLGQICKKLPPSKDVKDLIPKDDYSSKEPPRRSDLKSGIFKAVAACRSCSIIIDGLDECSKLEDNHFKDICSFISSLAENTNALTKVLVLSRPNYIEIDNIMKSAPKIQVDSGANNDDIEKFVSQKIYEIKSDPSPEDLSDFEEIKSRLVNKASGMFLYVRLKMRDFRDIGNAEDIKDSLEDKMEGLDDLYEHAMDSILKKPQLVKDRALMALLWITNSRRPLSKAELLEALSLKLERPGMSSSQRLSNDYSICRQCADLIDESGGFYYLIHGSLEDYLTSESTDLSDYSALQSRAHDILAEACLIYLNFEDFQKTRMLVKKVLTELQRQYPLLRYASSHWGSHYKQASLLGSRGSEIKRLSSQLLSVENLVELSLKIIVPYKHDLGHSDVEDWNFYRKPTALHLLSALNLKSLVVSVPNITRLINHLDHLGWFPIYYALIFESKEMCIWILEAIEARPDKQKLIDELVGGSSILLHRLARLDLDYVLQQLLSMNCDPNIRNEDGDTPLHWAANGGSKYAVGALLAAGADATMEANDGTTPLIEAVIKGELEVVKKILSKISNIPGEGSESSPRNRDIQADHLRGIKNIDHRRHNGDNAFLISCQIGPGHLVKLLLEHGADVRATLKGENGMHLACAHSHIDVLEVLLQSREAAELINAGDNEGYTPLHDAVYARDYTVATRLLQHGARPEVSYRDALPVLILSIHQGFYEFAETLIVDYNVDALERSNSEASTALDWAARRVHEFVFPDERVGGIEEDKRETFNQMVKRDLFKFANTNRFRQPMHRYSPGENYIECPEMDSLPKEQRRHFDEQGGLRREFFHELSEYYSSLDLSTMDEFVETNSGTTPPNEAKLPAELSSTTSESIGSFQAELEAMREVLGRDITDFLPQFISSEDKDDILWDAAIEILEKSDAVYFKREKSREGSLEFKEASEQIEMYEISWKLVHAILNVEHTQSAWAFRWERNVRRYGDIQDPGSSQQSERAKQNQGATVGWFPRGSGHL
ncbi:hypothetical protein CORC01_02546 [Colletotrichum orchidophilum]|uniref:Nephrocystin 3-like N-terminal domain-containing protein n=1 Tax=Colletotrichum orchidophilum TaxID=1209926 RepID=A0A1G4BLT3_9PEZI|nr:uncharacterized protein CORC01_02546 [Colletotrichum orchidophilum]OHF02266.1 hypothetical protein CORC01_02546 [Colletotrichum orchidophilum]